MSNTNKLQRLYYYYYGSYILASLPLTLTRNPHSRCLAKAPGEEGGWGVEKQAASKKEQSAKDGLSLLALTLLAVPYLRYFLAASFSGASGRTLQAALALQRFGFVKARFVFSGLQWYPVVPTSLVVVPLPSNRVSLTTDEP